MRFDRLILFHLLWLLPVAFWPGSNSYESLKFLILAMAVSFWLGHAAWQLWNGKQQWNIGSPVLGLVGSLILVLGSGIFTATNTTLVARASLLIFLFSLVSYITMRQRGGLQGQSALLATATMGASVVGLYSLLQIAHLLPGAPEASGYPPGISTLGNQNYVAGLMAITLWPALVLWRQTSHRQVRFIVIAAIVMILITLALAGATGPQLAVLAAGILVVPCIVLVLRGRGKQVPMLLGALFILLVGSGFGLLLDAALSVQKADSGLESKVTLHHTLLAANHGNVRITNWLTAMQMMQKESLVSGIGVGNYLVKWPEARARLETKDVGFDLPWGTPITTRAHNDYLQWVAETGVLGLIWVTFAFCYLAWAWRRRFLELEPHNQVNQLLLTGGLFTITIHALVSFPFHLPATSLVAAFTLGLIFLKDNVASPPKTRLPGKALSLFPAVVSLLLLAGSVQEFRGDLLIASGRNYFIQGKMGKALLRLEQGVQLMRWPAQGHFYLGLTQSALGQNDLAEKAFKQSLHDRPSFEAHLALAESAINRQNFPLAENHLLLVKSCRPQIDFYNQAGYLKGLLRLRQGRWDEAKLEFEEVLTEDPNRHRALLGLGYLEVLQGNPKQAKKRYTQCLKVINKKISEFQQQPQQKSTSSIVGLKQNRQVTIKALESLNEKN